MAIRFKLKGVVSSYMCSNSGNTFIKINGDLKIGAKDEQKNIWISEDETCAVLLPVSQSFEMNKIKQMPISLDCKVFFTIEVDSAKVSEIIHNAANEVQMNTEDSKNSGKEIEIISVEYTNGN